MLAIPSDFQTRFEAYLRKKSITTTCTNKTWTGNMPAFFW